MRYITWNVIQIIGEKHFKGMIYNFVKVNATKKIVFDICLLRVSKKPIVPSAKLCYFYRWTKELVFKINRMHRMACLLMFLEAVPRICSLLPYHYYVKVFFFLMETTFYYMYLKTGSIETPIPVEIFKQRWKKRCKLKHG